MKTPLYLKAFFILLLYVFTTKAYTNTIPKKSEQILKIDSILKTTHKFGLDTIRIKKHLEKTLIKANKNNDIPILWAYNMLMADTYSMIYDNTNKISNQYYKIARQLLSKHNYPELDFATNIRQGQYHFIYRKTTEAFPFFLYANHINSKIDIKKVPDSENNYRFIANFFGFIGSNDQAIGYLKNLLAHIKENSREHIDILNSISIYHKQENKNEPAKQYLNEALKVAEIAKDSVWIGIIYGNLSDYTWAEGDVNKTVDLLKKNIELSGRYDEPIDKMRASLKLAKYLISLQDWKNAKEYVKDALSLMEYKPYFLKHRVEASKLLAEISFLKGNYLEERKHLKDYIQLKKELDQQINIDEIQRISWKFEIEKYEQEIINNRIKENQLKNTYALIGFSILLIAVIIILLINRSRNKILIQNLELEEKELKVRLEKQKVDQELIQAKNSLTDFTEKIKRNNTIITKLRKELANTKIDDEKFKEKISEELNSMLRSHIMTQDKWIDFKKEFEILHPKYLQKHTIAHPSLTENDLRIISLMKLKLTNQSMCDLLGISLEGIKKAKQRLKKKMNSNTELG